MKQNTENHLIIPEVTKDPKSNAKIMVVGLGKAGVMFTEQLVSLKAAKWLNVIAVDTDLATLTAFPGLQKFQADPRWRNGAGCGGDLTNGSRSFSAEREGIGHLIDGVDGLIVTGGLGRGTATGGAGVFASVAKQKNIPTFFVMTMPFTMEGHNRRQTADKGVVEILPSADALFCLPMDLLFSSLPAETPITEAYAAANREMAGVILGLAEIMRSQSVMPADLSDFRTALNRRKSFCSIGVGTASSDDGANRCHVALEKMLKAPLLGGVNSFKGADVIFSMITGGADLNISEMKKTLEAAAAHFNPKAQIIIGAAVSEEYGNNVQVTAITVKYDKSETLPQVESRPITATSTKKRKSAGQGTKEQPSLPLQDISKGIFINAAPSIINGQDLDIPTCQRKMISIDVGMEQK
ncbi:MAG: hypothetical protein PHS31_05670 [Victivallaceae bacterium]|nr:hypothetical protein [Victivallaceae bacterium]MDD4181742.1 hypothetical protein [Victivallaceae bacterium]